MRKQIEAAFDGATLALPELSAAAAQFAGAVMAAPALVRGAAAQAYPARAVRVVVPFFGNNDADAQREAVTTTEPSGPTAPVRPPTSDFSSPNVRVQIS